MPRAKMAKLWPKAEVAKLSSSGLFLIRDRLQHVTDM
jgi:hypothetical protein